MRNKLITLAIANALTLGAIAQDQAPQTVVKDVGKTSDAPSGSPRDTTRKMRADAGPILLANDDPSNDTAHRIGDNVREAGHDVKNTAKEVGHGIKNGARQVGHHVKKTTQQVGHGAKAAAKKTGRAVKGTAIGVKESAKEVAGNVADATRHSSQGEGVGQGF